MPFPVQVSYRGIQPSDALEGLVRNEAAKLEQFFGGILACRVVIEHTYRRHREGAPFHARIELSVPGEDISVSQMADVRANILGSEDLHVRKRAEVDAPYKDPAFAIRSAFKKARRQLQDYVRRQAGAVKQHLSQPTASIAKLEKGYGFLVTEDGREIYFHRDSVLDEDFDHLSVGQQVRFVEEEGEKGPQASTVHAIK
ncbi:MAG: cold shock domain-containing protein [Vulcanimicrobiaceae bacterium]